jgi:hypothetical protein
LSSSGFACDRNCSSQRLSEEVFYLHAKGSFADRAFPQIVDIVLMTFIPFLSANL